MVVTVITAGPPVEQRVSTSAIVVAPGERERGDGERPVRGLLVVGQRVEVPGDGVDVARATGPVSAARGAERRRRCRRWHARAGAAPRAARRPLGGDARDLTEQRDEVVGRDGRGRVVRRRAAVGVDPERAHAERDRDPLDVAGPSTAHHEPGSRVDPELGRRQRLQRVERADLARRGGRARACRARRACTRRRGARRARRARGPAPARRRCRRSRRRGWRRPRGRRRARPRPPSPRPAPSRLGRDRDRRRVGGATGDADRSSTRARRARPRRVVPARPGPTRANARCACACNLYLFVPAPGWGAGLLGQPQC